MSKLVKVTINGIEVQVPEGMNLVEAAAQAGVEIPVFCHHPKLEPVGVCRMCLVEVEGQRKPVPACTMKAVDGMVVRTETPLVQHLRQGVIEFLLLNHPLDCPVCDKGGECPLQDNTFKYGLGTSRLSVPKMRKRKVVDLGNFIILDEERCILCRRCVRFDREITYENNLVVGERAHEALITTADGQTYDSYFSGNTIELCPVGALTSKTYRFKARPWDLSSVPSVCTGCSVGCNVRLDFRFGELMRLVARENKDVDDGWLCDRGRFNYRWIHGEERITRPLLRRDNEFVPVSWTEALQEVATRLKAIRRDHGADSIGFIGGGRLTVEEAYLFQKLARDVVGTPHVDHRVGRQVIASLAGFEGRIADLDDADVVVVVDVLPQEVMPVVDLRVRRAAGRRGAQLFALGPVKPPYRVPHTYIPAAPGETAAQLRRAAAADAGEPGALARALAGAKKAVVIWSGDDAGVGAVLLEAMQAWRAGGCDVRLLIPGEQANSRGAEAMGVRPDLKPGFVSVEEGAAGLDTRGMLAAAKDGRLQALYLASANVAVTFPDGALARAALENVPFLVVQDLFMTETARYADVILPAAEFPAKTGSYVNLEGRLQSVEQAMAPSGETRTDGDIFRAVAEALGEKLVSSEQEFRWEIQHVLGRIAQDGFLQGAPVSLLKGAAGQAVREGAASGGLRLVPVDRLYAGGGTARFDRWFSYVQPAAEAFMHPSDAAALQLSDGDAVEVASAAGAIRCTLRIDENVLPGTVQVPRGVPAALVNLVQGGDAYPAVTVRQCVLEEVGGR